MSWLGANGFRDLRNRALIGATAAAVRVLFLSLRRRVAGWRRTQELVAAEGVVYVIWHDVLMIPLGHPSCRGARAMISIGRDGDFAARVVHRFGIESIRGSTSRASLRALRDGIRRSGPGTALVVTPDGPRGPRYGFQKGAAWLAARTGLPVVPVGVAVRRAWRLKTWDRFCIPKPFARAHLVFGEPIRVEAQSDDLALERDRSRLEQALRAVSEQAATSAGTTWPPTL